MRMLGLAWTLGGAVALVVFGLMLVHCFSATTAAVDGGGGVSLDRSLSDSGAVLDGPSDSSTTSHGIDTGGVDAGDAGDASLPSSDVVTTCVAQDSVQVGSYVVETNYWNEVACPGTQCLTINDATGAFTVTEATNCGNTVSSYPNVLYGSSFGETSPGSALPKQVSALTGVISSWSFSTGGAPTDMFDVTYDIWFCPDNTCGASGFNGGTELMIWLNHPNTTNDGILGSVNLDGYSWQISTFAAGGAGDSWTYLAYMIQSSTVRSVTDLNLLSFFNDAESRGYLKSSSYLYAVQAGIELRTGGIPFTNNSFSVSVN
jgi:hypothetical protein